MPRICRKRAIEFAFNGAGCKFWQLSFVRSTFRRTLLEFGSHKTPLPTAGNLEPTVGMREQSPSPSAKFKSSDMNTAN